MGACLVSGASQHGQLDSGGSISPGWSSRWFLARSHAQRAAQNLWAALGCGELLQRHEAHVGFGLACSPAATATHRGPPQSSGLLDSQVAWPLFLQAFQQGKPKSRPPLKKQNRIKTEQ